MAEIRDATWEDFDAVVELLDTRSRAVFGVSEVQADHVRQRWELPGFERGWVCRGRRQARRLRLARRNPGSHGHDDRCGRRGRAARAGHRARHRARLRPCRGHRGPRRYASLVARRAERLRRRPRDPAHVAAARRRTAVPSWRNSVEVRTYTNADGTSVHALLDEAYAGWDRDYVAREHDAWLAVMTEHDELIRPSGSWSSVTASSSPARCTGRCIGVAAG